MVGVPVGICGGFGQFGVSPSLINPKLIFLQHATNTFVPIAIQGETGVIVVHARDRLEFVGYKLNVPELLQKFSKRSVEDEAHEVSWVISNELKPISEIVSHVCVLPGRP